MKRIAPVLLLTACSAAPMPLPPPTVPIPAPPVVVESPRVAAVDKPLADAVQTYRKTGKAPTLTLDGVTHYPYTDSAVIKCQFGKVTDLQFAAGERVSLSVFGQPGQWVGLSSQSGEGPSLCEHLAIAATEKGAHTNLLIYTNQRTYSLTLKESSSPHTRVAFWFPEVVAAQLAAYEEQQSMPTPSTPRQENDRYSVSGEAPWLPVRVFDDGTRCYILLPEQVRVSNMPVLYVSRGKTDELVNYSVQWPWLIVPQLFDKASLVSGVGREQQRVVIWRSR